MKRIFLLLITVSFFISTACKKECTEGSHYETAHSSYLINAHDTISYVDSMGNKSVYFLEYRNVNHVTNLVTTEYDHEDSYCWYTDIYCTDEFTDILYHESSNSSDQIKYNLRSDYYRPVKIYLSTNSFSDTINYQWNYFAGTNTKYFDTIQILGKEFLDVFKIYNADSSNFIYFQNQEGMIGFFKNVNGSLIFYRRE